MTQTLPQDKPRTFRISVEGELPVGVTAKDIVLHIIGEIGTAGATGYVVEYAGSAIRALSMEGRMTVCNMTIEGGARAGLIAPDETTFAYLKGRRFSPSGAAWDKAVLIGRYSRDGTKAQPSTREAAPLTTLRSLTPTVTWGTSPGMVTGIDSTVPLRCPADASEADRNNFNRALEYMDLQAGTPMPSRSQSIASSLVPARTLASKTFAPLPPGSSAASTSRRRSQPWLSPALESR